MTDSRQLEPRPGLALPAVDGPERVEVLFRFHWHGGATDLSQRRSETLISVTTVGLTALSGSSKCALRSRTGDTKVFRVLPPAYWSVKAGSECTPSRSQRRVHSECGDRRPDAVLVGDRVSELCGSRVSPRLGAGGDWRRVGQQVYAMVDAQLLGLRLGSND